VKLFRNSFYPLTGLFLLLFLSSTQIGAQSAADVTTANNFITDPNLPFDSTATADDITSMYFNPAGIGVHPLQIGAFYGNNAKDKLQDYLVFLNLFGLGLSTQWRQTSAFNAQRFTVGTGIESSNVLSIGTTYNWYKSSSAILDNYSEWDVGLILRPLRWLSMGTVARGLNLPTFQKVQIKPRLDAGVALRPIPGYNERLTISFDSTFYFDQRIQSIVPRISLEFIPVKGFTFYGGTVNLQDYFFGLKIAQNITQISFQGAIPHNQGQFYSGGILVSQERFDTDIEAIKHYLEIPLNQNFQETKKTSIFFLPENISFFDLISGIRRAIKDPQISGIVIRAGNFRGGWAQAEELRNALLQFQETSGKPVYAYLDSASNIDYYIATSAEKIIMPPAGSLRLNGLKAEVFYLKGLLDYIGIEPEFISIGDYKSAPHIFTLTNPDKFEKEQMNNLLQNTQYELKRAIISRRKKIPAGQIEKLFNHGIFTVSRAKEVGLIDDVMYFPEIKEKYLKISSSLISWNIELKNYIKSKIYQDDWGIRPAIALLVLEGEIAEENENNTPLIEQGSKISLASTVKTLEKIRKNPVIKSVVIRINSPGGSGLTSDILWKEIRMLQQEKPVVISIGNTAASGGYYLAVGADEILADQTSVTGSIGVFFGKFNLKNLYKKFGIHKEIYKLNEKSAIFSEAEEFSTEEKNLIHEQMVDFYQLFLDRVERGRTNISRAQVEENANGQVYTGGEAKKRGMVDKIGGLSLAIEIAKNRAKISDTYSDILVFPADGENIFNGNNPLIPLPGLIKSAIKILDKSEKMGASDSILFLMPYDLSIK